ncbi:MAG: ATP-dependent helicase [Bifidobacterium sp.]|nr:ATP-dependent helicase [Bifidobacterium sp.]
MDTNAHPLLDGLDDAQRQAAAAVDGPVRIIACAGAGKTRTITRRIAYGCASGAWDPARTLAVTFSVKAATEMRERLRGLGVPDGVRAATFHSAALRQCREAWPDLCEGDFPDVLDDKREVVGTAIVRATGGHAEPRVIADTEKEIDWCKVSLVTPDDYLRVCAATGREAPAPWTPEQLRTIYREYEDEKTKRMAIDFNDILLIVAHIFDAGDDVARRLRHGIGWLTVDEYQDVSPLQHLLMRAWLGDNRNVCVVGDPAQTIYSFAGATSYYLEEFGREFAPLAEDIALRTDYRSVPPIVSQANAVLRRAPRRDGYVVFKPARDGGARVASAIYEDDTAEARAVAGRLRQLIAQGVKARDCAVLTRLQAQQPLIVRALREQGVPYQVKRDAGSLASAAAADAPASATPLDSLEAVENGRVTISTIHASKGLEFKHVFLVGLSDGLLPYFASTDPVRLEEERRLLYVGVTRAMDTLHLSYARHQDGRGGRPRLLTRFLQ